MNIPNFFIVGAAKSGTTLIYKLLNSNSFFSFSRVKETHYLLKDEFNLENYLNYFNSSSDFIGEASVSYLPSHKKVVKKIRDINDRSKIIIVLRNPFERFVSHYQYYRQLGYEVEDIENVCSEMHRPKNDPWGEDYNPYLCSSLYYESIKHYMDNFENILLITFEEVVENKVVVSKLSDFFGVEIPCNGMNLHEKVNETLVARFTFIDKVLSNNAKRALANLLPVQLKRIIKSSLFKKPERSSIKLSKEITEIFDNDIKKLMELTNLDLSHWRSK